MDPFEQVENKIRRREKAIDARELAARLKEIEKELDAIPVTPTYKQEEASHRSKSRRPFFHKIGNAGMFIFTVVGVTTVVCLAHWVGLTLLIMGAVFAAWAGKAVVIMGVIWIAYKLFLAGKN
jgi:hypothetical protein